MLTALARSTILCVALASMSLCGCRRNSDDLVEDVEKSVRSWAATVDMTADEYYRGRAPRAYVEQVVDAAREALDEQRESLAKVPSSDARRTRLDVRIASLHQRLDALATDPRRGPRT